MPRRVRGHMATLGAALAAISCIGAEPAPTDEALEYVGRARCASCHPQQDTLWQGSDHDLAMEPATVGTVLGRFDSTVFVHDGVTSTFYRRGDAFMVRTEGPDGTLDDYEVAYTFGARPLQQYLIPFPDGRYQALGVAWDARPASEGGQRWFHLYPNERIPPGDELHWTSPNQRWNYMCAECHSTALRKGYDRTSDRYQTTWSEIDVSCEACHGPGSAHAAWADAGATATDPRMGLAVIYSDRRDVAWVIDAATGIAERRGPGPAVSRVEIESCARCHARRGQITGEYDYGRPLTTTHRPALLEAGLYHADGQILDEVYVYGSFLQSRMYQAGVTCSDCHDPHSLSVRGDGNGVCATCHLPSTFETQTHHFHDPDGAGGQCVACHAPSRPYMVVDPRRDHSFRIPRPDLSLSIGTPNACTGCHDDRSSDWAASAVSRSYGPTRRPHYGPALHAGRERHAGAGGALAALASDSTVPGIVRGTALTMLAQNPVRDVEQVLAQALTDPDPLVRMGALTGAAGLDPGATIRLVFPLLTDSLLAVQIAAARVAAPVPSPLIGDEERAARQAAVEAYRASQLVNAERPESFLNLGGIETALGNYEEAERAYRAGLELDQRFEPIYVNLADLYRLQQRDTDGESVLRNAIGLLPEGAALHHALGLTLVRLGQREAALGALGRAAALAPEAPRYAYVFAVALSEWSSADSARRIVAQALERHPSDPELELLQRQLAERR